MAHKKKETVLAEAIESIQTAPTVITAQPLQAADAALTIGAWASSILVAKSLLDQVTDDKWLKFIKSNPQYQSPYFVSTGGTYNPALFGLGGILISWITSNIQADLTKVTITDEEHKAFVRARWELAFMYGTIGYSVIRFSGGDLMGSIGGMISKVFV